MTKARQKINSYFVQNKTKDKMMELLGRIKENKAGELIYE